MGEMRVGVNGAEAAGDHPDAFGAAPPELGGEPANPLLA